MERWFDGLRARYATHRSLSSLFPWVERDREYEASKGKQMALFLVRTDRWRRSFNTGYDLCLLLRAILRRYFPTHPLEASAISRARSRIVSGRL